MHQTFRPLFAGLAFSLAASLAPPAVAQDASGAQDAPVSQPPPVAQNEAGSQDASVVGPIDGGARTMEIAGYSLTAIGAAAGLGGGIAYAVLSAQGTVCPEADGACPDPNRTAKSASLLTALIGGATLAVGIPLALTSEERQDRARRRRQEHRVSAPELLVGPSHLGFRFSF